MTVGELRKMLEQFPDDMKVITDQHSDYAYATECGVVRGVENGDWIMRAHKTMSEENKSKAEEFLYLGANENEGFSDIHRRQWVD